MTFKSPFHSTIGFATTGIGCQSGNAAVDTSRSYEDADLGALESTRSAKHALDWGACLRTHHFQLGANECTPVRRRMGGRSDVDYLAVSVVGAGKFKQSDDSPVEEFHNGAVIVQAAGRTRFYTFEDFRRMYLLQDGGSIESIYQLGVQTPNK